MTAEALFGGRAARTQSGNSHPGVETCPGSLDGREGKGGGVEIKGK